MCLHVPRTVSRFTLALGVPSLSTETEDKWRSRFMDSQLSAPPLARSRISEEKKRKRQKRKTSASLVIIRYIGPDYVTLKVSALKEQLETKSTAGKCFLSAFLRPFKPCFSCSFG